MQNAINPVDMKRIIEAIMDMSEPDEGITYTRIDAELLSRLPEPNRNQIERHLLWILRDFHEPKWPGESFPYKDLTDFLESGGLSYFFGFCPYCNRTYLLATSIGGKRRNKKPSVCVYCAEISPYWKFASSLSKINELVNLMDDLKTRGRENSVELSRVLLEQALVMIATGIEVFLRDIYAITMNMRYVKPDISLFRRFYNDSRNDFTNMGKAKMAFKKDIGIDLNKIISQESRTLLELLMAKRNIIVHNNGFVDETFMRQTDGNAMNARIRKLGQTPSLKEQVPVSRNELDLYRKMADEMSLVLGQKFRKEFENVVIDKLTVYVEENEITRKYV